MESLPSDSLDKIKDVLHHLIESDLNFFCYRLPGADTVNFGYSEKFYKGIYPGCFIVAPFDNDPDMVFSIPAHEDIETNAEEVTMVDPVPMPLESTGRESYMDQVEYFKRIIDGNPRHKIIASRRICGTSQIDTASSFANLLASYPDAFVFCFRIHPGGLWLGASPELLLAGNNGELQTMALAGTRKAGSALRAAFDEWDTKNLHEQKIVEDFINETFIAAGLSPEIDGPFTKQAGPVEHLCSVISAKLPEGTPLNLIIDLLGDLSPTPALCGYPLGTAMRAITATETPREYYGGYIGLMESPYDFNFQVCLRCMKIESGGWCLFSGGGITASSDADTEWEETEIKSSTLLSRIAFSQNNHDS